MKIAVYCASEFGKEELYTEAARELGQGGSEHLNIHWYMAVVNPV